MELIVCDVDAHVNFFKHFRKEQFYLCSLNTIPLALFYMLATLAVFKKYPFTVPRTALFFAPMALYCLLKGFFGLRFIHIWLGRIGVSFYVLFLTAVSLGLARLIFGGDLGAIPILWGQ